MKVIVQSTKSTKIFKEGQELEMEMNFSINATTLSITVDLYVAGYEALTIFYHDQRVQFLRGLHDFFTGKPDIIKGWQFIRLVDTPSLLIEKKDL